MGFLTIVAAPVVLAAILAGSIRAAIVIANGRKDREHRALMEDAKRLHDREMADQARAHQESLALTERAWADYGMRRDLYLQLTKQIECLFAGGSIEARAEFHRTARCVRLIADDDVVKRLNEVTAAISNGEVVDSHSFGRLCNAIRCDIRKPVKKPPVGNSLDEDDFLLEF